MNADNVNSTDVAHTGGPSDVAGASLRDAVARDNPAFVQLLGLCPLLAVSTTVANALGLALATLFVLVGSNVAISAVRRLIPEPARLPAQMVIIAGFTTGAMLLLQAFAFDVYERIALFVQIIVTNCVILARAERVARRTSVAAAARDGCTTGIGFAAALLSLGIVREALGHATLFAGFERLFGAPAATWEIDLGGSGLLVAVLPPGAFIVAALLIACANSIAARFRRPHQPGEAS